MSAKAKEKQTNRDSQTRHFPCHFPCRLPQITKKKNPQKKTEMKIPRKNSNSSGTRRPEKSKVPTFIKSIFFFVGELHSIVCVGGGGGGDTGEEGGRGSRESESSASSSSLSCRILVIYNVTFFAFCARI